MLSKQFIVKNTVLPLKIVSLALGRKHLLACFGLLMAILFLAFSLPVTINDYQAVFPIKAGAKYLWNNTYYMNNEFNMVILAGVISLAIAITTAIIQLAVGGLLGYVSSKSGRPVNKALDVFTGAVEVFPVLPAVALIVAIYGASFWKTTLIIGILLSPNIITIFRNELKRIRRMAFYQAALCNGVNYRTLLVRYVIPNMWVKIASASLTAVANVMLIETGASFLGIGFKTNLPSIGNILNELYNSTAAFNAWHVIPPAITLGCLLTCFYYTAYKMQKQMSNKYNY